MHTKTIGLIAHTGKRDVAELVNAIAKEFERFSISILFEKETARVAGKQLGYPIAELGAMTDLLVVAGGDGSILRVIGQLGETIKPIFGINVGSLGFLTCVSSSNYREAVECIAKDRINFSHRALLEARVSLGDKRTNKMLALNDAALSRVELSRLVMLCTRVNGEPVYLKPEARATIQVGPGSIVTVRKAKKTLPLASLPDASFFSVVRQKLKWSVSNV